jgi:hypothetical protein
MDIPEVWGALRHNLLFIMAFKCPHDLRPAQIRAAILIHGSKDNWFSRVLIIIRWVKFL